MAISPINVSRVSNGLRTSFALDSLRRTQIDLFREQNRIASGRQFVSPSEDPVAATRAIDLKQALAQADQFAENLTHADQLLVAADSALVEVNDLLIQASTLASQNLSNLTSAEERAAIAELVTGIRTQLQSVGNRQLNGRYIFAGKATTSPPFVNALNGIAYVGDTAELVTAIDDNQTAPLTVPGSVLFGALSSRIASNIDLSSSLTEQTRLEDVNGASGAGVRRGVLVFNEEGGAGVFTVDLSTADTIGDVVNQINQSATAAGASVQASIAATGIVITPSGNAVSIHDTSTGIIAADLGIFRPDATSASITGLPLGPRLTTLTPVSALGTGASIDWQSGLLITNGDATATVNLSEALTVQDVINRINNAGVHVLARINDQGTGIDVVNQVSGTSLRIGENGGSTASNLGLRSLDLDTPLSDLNSGRGITLDPNAEDLRIVTANGTPIDIDLDGAETIGDVIELINEATTTAGASLSASLAIVGNGILLNDSTGGTGELRVVSLNQSVAAHELGLTTLSSISNTEMVGADMNPVRTTGVLTALIDLERSLRDDNTQSIALAGEDLDRFVEEVTRTHGVVGSRSQSMRRKLEETQDSVASTRVLLSEVQDLDYAEAITKLQASTTQLQANLQVSATLLNLSLLDFLR